MKIEKFGVYLADLNPALGTEAGKVRPVVVVQTNLLNNVHPSTIVCPITSKTVSGAQLLRVHTPKQECGLEKDSDILVDQVRAIDNRRFIRQVGKLGLQHKRSLLRNLQLLILE